MAYTMDINMKRMQLGTTILKFQVPLEFIDEINKLYDDNVKDLQPWNDRLIGKLKKKIE
jgi:hypothetical protein